MSSFSSVVLLFFLPATTDAIVLVSEFKLGKDPLLINGRKLVKTP